MDLKKLLTSKQISFKNYNGLFFVSAANQQQGTNIAFQILLQLLDRKTVMYLSGGKTPKDLYEQLAQNFSQANSEVITPGAVAMIDERFAEKLHANSNELMIKQTKLLRNLELHGVNFYPILQNRHSEFISESSQGKQILKKFQDDELNESAERYDQTIRGLFAHYPKSVGILGIGNDGHTAGVPAAGNLELRTKNPSRLGSRSEADLEQFSTEMVMSYDDTSGKYGKRITMTFLGLSMLDVFIVLVFGEDKKKALQAMFAEGTEEEIPARFYLRPEIAQKTILITDQEINN
ncbi:MAG TPA: 6-phosphogluconolactonase [Patescibacteria group bacterium]|nr:6-phosphogluconolactonase [Patescibacteria group bacterium]